ncbi:MAG: hypothetical protein JNK10_08430 [Cyclobacteriaceae bacterium]|nr:hypothetical protein [Cyclobacteriaceae bacterium]
MRFSLVLIALIVYGAAYGQSVNDLDSKGGFKNYKIGDEFSAHGDKIKFTKNLENPETKQYVVRDPVTVMSHTAEVELTFYKYKLSAIIVSFKNSSKEDYQELLESLQTLYGEPEQLKDKEKDKESERFEKVFVWNGQQVALRMGYDQNYKLSEMTFYQQKGKLEKLKSEF